MGFAHLKLDATGPVRVLTLNRPQSKNAFTPEMLAELRSACSALAADGAVRVLVLRAEGDHFCSGADLGWMKASAALSREENLREARELFDTFFALHALPFPTLAVAHGPAYGGGLGLLAACDLALAAEEAAFAFTEVRLGLAPAVIAPFILKRSPAAWVRDVMLSGRRFTAREGEAQEFFQGVIPAIGLEEAVGVTVGSLLKGSPAAQRKIKELLDAAVGFGPERLKDYLADAIAGLRASEEGQEGLAAFFEKRAPSWHPKSS
jgi:methylglutaconyl-CoA hydratase